MTEKVGTDENEQNRQKDVFFTQAEVAVTKTAHLNGIKKVSGIQKIDVPWKTTFLLKSGILPFPP